MRIDDKTGTLTLKDNNGNTVTLADSGITLDSASKITMTAKTDIVLSAQGKLSLTGTAGVSIAGATIAAKADTSFAAQGIRRGKTDLERDRDRAGQLGKNQLGGLICCV
ncbi:hypothetical protein ACVBEF_12295 [Glaciimonas sp. GG7]